ncbi:MAG: Rho termination factor N-terminal domain-containing protein [Candidatus Odinarchaeota archaeon]
MTEFERFMVYELDDSGERIKLQIDEEQLQENLHPEQVLVIIREDLRRIFIWKGPKSPVRKRFISSRVASTLQEELMKDPKYHRCKIVSVDAGDEPSEFLDAFKLSSMEVTERLEDMRYVRNIERERGVQATITDINSKKGVSHPEEEYFSPALQDVSSKIVSSSYARNISTPKARATLVSPSSISKAENLSDEDIERIKNKILKNEISDNYKRINLILGHTLYAAVAKTAKVFGKDVEETEWEPVKKVPKDMIELENHLLRVYFDEKKGIVDAVEILEKLTTHNKKELMQKASVNPVKETKSEKEVVNFNTMTVKDLKAYAEEKKVELPSNARKADIIEILEKSQEKKTRRKLPEIPKSG